MYYDNLNPNYISDNVSEKYNSIDYDLLYAMNSIPSSSSSRINNIREIQKNSIADMNKTLESLIKRGVM